VALLAMLAQTTPAAQAALVSQSVDHSQYANAEMKTKVTCAGR
jgi:hypothetical protein